MAVTSLKIYEGVPRDRLENYHGNQLVFLSWDRHLLFAAPFIFCVSPDSTFRDLVDETIVPRIQADPDAGNVDWSKVEWMKSNQPWTPDFKVSLAANGIRHKDQIRFRTPGLNTLGAGGE